MTRIMFVTKKSFDFEQLSQLELNCASLALVSEIH